jgi:hypothetical protein
VKYELIDPTRPGSAKPFEGADDVVRSGLLAQVLNARKVTVRVSPARPQVRCPGSSKSASVYER